MTLGQILHDDRVLAVSRRDATIHGWDHRGIGIREMNHRRPIRQDIVIVIPIRYPSTILPDVRIRVRTIRTVTMRPKVEIVKGIPRGIDIRALIRLCVEILALIRLCAEILAFILRNVDTRVTIP